MTNLITKQKKAKERMEEIIRLKPGDKPDGYLMRGATKMVTQAIYQHDPKPLILDKPEIVFVGWEDDDNYYGNFTTGFGIFGIRFPKEFTRDLNKKEIAKYKKLAIQHSNGLVIKDFV